MKKVLVLILSLAMALFVVSCGKDYVPEDKFLDISEPGDDEKPGNPYWDWADSYPGTVSQGIERSYDVQVTIKGGTPAIAYSPEIPVLHSTSLYVAMEEDVEVIVPAGVDELHYQIGIGHALPPEQIRRRYGDVVTRGKLEVGENTISSYFGGYLYFYYPVDKVPANDITVTVNHAVPSFDYIDGVTDLREWTDEINSRATILATGTEDKDSANFLNWAELRSDKVILTMGVPGMEAISNPQVVMDYYGKIADAYLWFGGHNSVGQPPMRVYTDFQVPDPTQDATSPAVKLYRYGGYPIGYIRGQNVTTIVDEKRLLNTDFLRAQSSNGSNWYNALFGFGLTVIEGWQNTPFLLQPSLDMGYYHYARTLGLWPGKFINFADNVNKLNAYIHPLDASGKYLMYDKEGADTRLTMMMQLTAYLGWGVFPYVSEKSREYEFTPEWGQDAHDFFVMSACEYAGENLLPFFKQWHFPYTVYAAEYAKKFPAVSGEFWKSFDNNFVPSFVKRTPNNSFEPRAEKPTFNWYNKTGWKLTATVTHAVTGNIMGVREDKEYPGAFDDNLDTYEELGNHLLYKQKDSLSHKVQVTLHLGDTPVEFNALGLYHQRVYFANKIHEIEYYDDATGEWKPTAPNEIRFLFVLERRSYYWEQTYKSTKIRFYMQPKVNDWNTGSRLMWIKEIDIGLVK